MTWLLGTRILSGSTLSNTVSALDRVVSTAPRSIAYVRNAIAEPRGVQ